jgi:hypothetical protein
MERNIRKMYEAIYMQSGLSRLYVELNSFPSFLRVSDRATHTQDHPIETFVYTLCDCDKESMPIQDKRISLDEIFLTDSIYMITDSDNEFHGMITVNNKILYEFPFVYTNGRHEARIDQIVIFTGNKNCIITLTSTPLKDVDHAPTLFALGLKLFLPKTE